MALKTKKVNPAFGRRLAELREAAGLTQATLAEKGGIPLGTIRELEQGRREPLFSNMQKLAAALSVSLDGWPAAALPDSPPPTTRERGRPRNAAGASQDERSAGSSTQGPSDPKNPATGHRRKRKGKK